MDIDAALKDGYSIQEINAEAAKRTGFNLEGARADGYTDDEILQELRNRVSKQPSMGQKGLDVLTAGAETAAMLGTGAIGGLLAAVPTTIQKAQAASQGETLPVEQQLAANMGAMTYEPRSELGQEWGAKAGQFVGDVLVPAAVAAQGLPYVNTLAPILSAVGKNLSRTKMIEKAPLVKEAAHETHIAEIVATKAEKEKQAALLKAEQQDIFAPETNMHRAYTDLRVPEENPPLSEQSFVNIHGKPVEVNPEGSAKTASRAMTKDEFVESLRNLAEPETTEQARKGTGFQMPKAEELDAAYENYLQHVNEKQGNLFDINSRQEEFQRGIREDQIPKKIETNRFVQNIVDKVSKQEQVVLKLQMDLHDGRPVEGILKRAELDLKALEQKEQTIRAREEATASRRLAKQKVIPKELEFYPTEREGHPFMENPAQNKDTLEHAQRQKADVENALAAGSGEPPQATPRVSYERAAQSVNYTPASPLHNIPGIAGKLADVGFSEITSPEHALELSKQVPDINQNTYQKFFNYLTKGSWLKTRIKDPTFHFTVDRLNTADHQSHAVISEQIYGKQLPALRDLKGKERVETAQLLNTADLNETSITPEMMEKWGLSTAQKRAIEIHQENAKLAFESTNRALLAVGKNPITERAGYAAMDVKGNYRAVAYKQAKDEAGNLKFDANGNPSMTVVGVVASDINKWIMPKKGQKYSPWSVDRIKEEMLQRDPELQFSETVNMSLLGDNKSSLQGSFLEVMKQLGHMDSSVKDFITHLQEVAKSDPSNYMGMEKHTKAKKGVWGMEGRKPWLSPEENAEAFYQNQIAHNERAIKYGYLAEAAADVNKVLRDPSVAIDKPNVALLGERYLQHTLGVTSTKTAGYFDGALTTLLTLNNKGNRAIPAHVAKFTREWSNKLVLGWLNLPYLHSQLIQPVLETPAMATLLKNRGLSNEYLGMTSLAKGGMTLGKMVRGGKQVFGDYTPLELGALEYAKKNAVFPEDIIEHSQDISKDVLYYANKSASILATKADTFTRGINFFGFVHMLDEAGVTPEQGLYRQAHELTKKVMGTYNRAERPLIYDELGMLGDSIYNLQSYSHGQASKLAFFAREIGKDPLSVKAYTPFIMQMLATIAGAGVLGLPYYALYSGIYTTLSSYVGSPRDLTLDVINTSKDLLGSLGEDAQYMLSHGVFAAAGIDMSNRLAGPSFGAHGLVDTLAPASSKLGQAAGSTAKALVSPSGENVEAALYNAAPAGAQGLLDTLLFQDDALALNKDPSKLHTTASRTPQDTQARRLGYTGIQESVQKAEEYRNKTLDMAYETYRAEAINDLLQDVRRGRELSTKAIDKYIVTGQGDSTSLDTELSAKVKSLSISPRDAALLKAAMATRIPQQQSLLRRTQ